MRIVIIVVDREMRTNVPGVFAAGDCVATWRQVVVRLSRAFRRLFASALRAMGRVSLAVSPTKRSP